MFYFPPIISSGWHAKGEGQARRVVDLYRGSEKVHKFLFRIPERHITLCVHKSMSDIILNSTL